MTDIKMVALHSIVRLEKSLAAWATTDFQAVAKAEIEQLDASLLPLQQGISQGSYVTDEKFKVMIIGVTPEQDVIRLKAGIFYNSIIAGCNCSDDPTPLDTLPEYCVVQFVVDKITAETRVELLPD